MSGRAWTREKSSMIGTKLEFTDRSTTQIGTVDEKMRTRRTDTAVTGSASNSSSERVVEEV